jgi:hypothetical protein
MSLSKVFTGHPQFGDERDAKVMSDILQGVRPKRPTAKECGGVPMPDKWWNVASACLRTDAHRRPGVDQILEMVTGQRGASNLSSWTVLIDNSGLRWKDWIHSLMSGS